jgi:zinc protease
MRLFAAPTATKDFVRIEGSVLGGSTFFPQNEQATAILAAELLDAGTAKRDKDTIREALASRGASLSFSAQGDRTFFSASCLPEDISFLLNLIVECLSQASFPEKEITLAKERIIGGLTESKTDTNLQARIAYARLVYEAGHANYATTTDEDSTAIRRSTRKQLKALQAVYGHTGLIAAIAGDVDPKKTLAVATTAFSKLPKGSAPLPAKKLNTKKQLSKEVFVTVVDKANIDVFAGSSVGFDYDDARFVPFAVLLSMLGGRGLSSGHFMRTIRERDGLTYGIYSIPAGFEDKDDGGYRIWATFAPAVYKKGIAAIRKEIEVFLATGITKETLRKKQDEITGRFQISLSTASGLAAVLAQIASEQKPLSYIDDYPNMIRAVTIADLKKVASLISTKTLAVAAAGTPAE